MSARRPVVTMLQEATNRTPVPSDPRQAELVDVWTRRVGPVVVDESGDWEDWVECAYRVLAAERAFGSDVVVVAPGQGGGLLASHPGASRDDAVLELGVRYGHHAPPSDRSDELASDYFTLETFRARAGRRLELADALSGDERDADQVMARMAADGADAFFVKARATKVLTTRVTRGQSLLDAAEEHLGEGASWVLVGLEGQRDALVVQEFVPMRYEYRVFVVGGVPVTAAGCIEERTPLDRRDGEPFDDVLRELRGAGHPAERLPHVRDELLAFAAATAGELAAEAPEMIEYVIDVALGPNGPLVVELNGRPNAGFYASDPVVLYRALADQERREGRHR